MYSTNMEGFFLKAKLSGCAISVKTLDEIFPERERERKCLDLLLKIMSYLANISLDRHKGRGGSI